MDYGRAPWLGANAFCSADNEAYVDTGGYIFRTVHLNWLSSFEWQHRCVIMTNCLGFTYYPTSCDRRDCLPFQTVVGTGAWLLGYKLVFLSRDSARAYPPSFDLWTIRASEKVVVWDHL